MSQTINLTVQETSPVNLSTEQARVIRAVSPTLDAERVEGGVQITVEDYREDPQTVVVCDGQTGPQGPEGPAGKDGKDGADGAPGVDGVSPTASVTQTATGAVVTVTDASGTTTATLTNGAPGQPGQDGADGVGVPAGGTTGQILAKKSNTNYDTEWQDAPSGGGGESWKSVELSSADYDTTLKMFVFDAGQGKEIKEVRLVGQIVYDTALSSAVLGVGFGNVSGRQSYNEFASKSATFGTAATRIMIEAEGYNLLFGSTRRSQYGRANYGGVANAYHGINVDIVANSAFETRGTNIYNNFNDPRYLHIKTPEGVSWAYIYIEYRLR